MRDQSLFVHPGNGAVCLGNGSSGNIYCASFDETTGYLGNWSNQGAFPNGADRSAQTMGLTDTGDLWLTEGYDNSGHQPMADLHVASMTPAGIIGNWLSLSPALGNRPRYEATGIANGSWFVQAVGTDDPNAQTALGDTWIIRRNANGQIERQQGGSVSPRYSAAMASYGNHVYLTGGHTGQTGLATVFMATVTSAGISGWSVEPHLLAERYEHAAVAGMR
mgnify:FL=1